MKRYLFAAALACTFGVSYAQKAELAEAQKEAALIRASDWLNRKVMWNGRKASRSQRMAWPRAGVSTQDGPVPSDEVPAEVVEACCELAGFFVEQDYLAPLDRGGDIASLGVDVISIAYNGHLRRMGRG